MKLADLLFGIADVHIDLDIRGLSLDTRKVDAGDLFIALNGALQHGICHGEQAFKNGAIAMIYDPEGVDERQLGLTGQLELAIADLSLHLGEIAARFYGRPSQQMDVIGITGTNGKTTCSQLIAQALDDCGVIGTLGWGDPGKLMPTINTTPDALAVQKILNLLMQQGKRAVTMEVSSHGLEQGRVNAVEFIGAVFTNLTRDHLDYHGSMQAYLGAKLKLFTNPALKFAVVNLDDLNSPAVLDVLHPQVKSWGFSTRTVNSICMETIVAQAIHNSPDGIRFEIHWSGQIVSASTPLIGAFNLENVLTVLCVLLAMGWTLEKAVTRLTKLQAVIGRMEKLGGEDKPLVIVDYAHTPDALEKVLQASKGRGRLWLVFGCGGDRDRGKRPQMGRIAETYADRVVVTDDNPRSEASDAIIHEIMAGCSSNKISIINDRQAAITSAIQQAEKNDCVVIAGKGHENYQEIMGRKLPFSDQNVAMEALAEWGRH